jgi:hypothetical protein
MTALQRSLPQDKLARVFGAFFTFVLMAISLGALVTPLVLGAAGLGTTLWLAGALVPALCLLGWPSLRRMDEMNVAELAEIAPRVALLQRAALLAESSRSTLERLAKESTMVIIGTDEDAVREGEEADAPRQHAEVCPGTFRRRTFLKWRAFLNLWLNTLRTLELEPRRLDVLNGARYRASELTTWNGASWHKSR